MRWVRRVCRYESARHCLSERIWYNRVPFDIFNLRYFCDSVKSRHTHVFAIDCDRLAESPSFDIAFRTHPDESQFSARRERKRVVQDGRTPPSAHGTTKRDEIAGRERKATNLIKTEPAIPSSNAEETAPRHTGPRASIGCAKSPMRQPRHNQPFKPRREHFYQ